MDESTQEVKARIEQLETALKQAKRASAHPQGRDTDEQSQNQQVAFIQTRLNALKLALRLIETRKDR